MRHSAWPAPANDARFRRMARTIRTAATALALSFAVLAVPTSAQAAEGPTVAQSLAIADAFHGPHACAGQVRVVVDPTLGDRGRDGEPSGMVAFSDGDVWLRWHVARCEVAIAPGLDPAYRCDIIVHEVGHLVHGPAHDGPMSDENLIAPACRALTPRQRLIQRIRDVLPNGSQWRVVCGPSGKRMRCRATHPSARHARLYRASIADGTVKFARLARR